MAAIEQPTMQSAECGCGYGPDGEVWHVAWCDGDPVMQAMWAKIYSDLADTINRMNHAEDVAIFQGK